jgi:hypothetical protein
MPKERKRRYSIEIKDATGRSVWFAGHRVRLKAVTRP